eukprot:SM000844S23317  [mRNA]  locus=s844:1890:2230:- [translate_table: standard]
MAGCAGSGYFVEPLHLECGHVLCVPCVRQVVQAAGGEAECRCPVCQRPIGKHIIKYLDL